MAPPKHRPTKYPDDIRDRVEHWRQRIIPEYEVVLVAHPLSDDDPDETQAQSRVTHDYLVIQVWLNLEHPSFRRNEVTVTLDQTIVHELLHAVLHDLETAFDPVKYDLLPPQMGRLLDQTKTTALERAIERLSRIIVDDDRTVVL